MSLHFISDSTVKTTGVYIPIKEWNELKSKYKHIELEKTDISGWYKEIVRQRLADLKKSPGHALAFDDAMDDIEHLL